MFCVCCKLLVINMMLNNSLTCTQRLFYVNNNHAVRLIYRSAISSREYYQCKGVLLFQGSTISSRECYYFRGVLLVQGSTISSREYYQFKGVLLFQGSTISSIFTIPILSSVLREKEFERKSDVFQLKAIFLRPSMIYIYYFLGVFPSTMVDNTDNLIRKPIELFRSFVLHRTLYITRRTN